MKLVEIEPDALERSAPVWLPYAQRIADREGLDPSTYIDELRRGEARLFVIWDETNNRAFGAAATRVLLRNNTLRIGELHWLAGDRMSEWLPQFVPEVEEILRRDGVQGFRVTGRPGFARALKPFGYSRKKVILEKGL